MSWIFDTFCHYIKHFPYIRDLLSSPWFPLNNDWGLHFMPFWRIRVYLCLVAITSFPLSFSLSLWFQVAHYGIWLKVFLIYSINFDVVNSKGYQHMIWCLFLILILILLSMFLIICLYENMQVLYVNIDLIHILCTNATRC